MDKGRPPGGLRHSWSARCRVVGLMLFGAQPSGVWEARMEGICCARNAVGPSASASGSYSKQSTAEPTPLPHMPQRPQAAQVRP
jgi:hypothetical protein